jgi:phenylacetate-CoA ligase
MNKTPMEEWIRQRTLPLDDQPLTRPNLEAYQLGKLREMVSYAKRQSPFYRELLAAVGEREVEDLAEFRRLPFTTPADLRLQGMRMLCTSQDEIERVVTLQTSGTTGDSKRVFFTAQDLESTVDFFHHGMSTMVGAGDTVIVFLPGERPDSVGDLLARGLARLGVQSVIFGPIRDTAAAREEIMRHRSPCLVGIPTQILALARAAGSETIPKGWVQSVLLSTDYVSTAIEAELERLWGCRVFTHYGLTETGLGGGVECEAGDGYHLREADLYTEIVDPVTGLPAAEGSEGEVVFTTLTRRGMPLIRYRTGDRARMLPEPCPCGSSLKRLGRVRGRLEAEVLLKKGGRLTMAALDEALFPIAGLLNFTAEVAESAGRDHLHLCFQVLAGEEEGVARKALNALLHGETLAPLFENKALAVGGITFGDELWFSNGTAKRQISDTRPTP